MNSSWLWHHMFSMAVTRTMWRRESGLLFMYKNMVLLKYND
jgi:hypothetical protein